MFSYRDTTFVEIFTTIILFLKFIPPHNTCAHLTSFCTLSIQFLAADFSIGDLQI